MSVQEIIKQRRIKLDLTLKDVAKALNVSEGTVSRYESGEIQNMGVDKIAALAKVLQCNPGYLMGWTDDPSLKAALSNQDSKEFISDSEEELVSKYRRLDSYDQGRVLGTIDTLLDQDKYHQKGLSAKAI